MEGGGANLKIPKQNGPAITGRRHRFEGLAEPRQPGRRQPGSGTEVSQRDDPARPESRRPALRGAWQERNRTSVERGEPPAWDFQKHQVCNLAAACYTPCPSCPCSRHLQVRGVRPQSSPPRARPAQKHKPGVRGHRSLRLVSADDAASGDGSGSVPSSGAQRTAAVRKQQPRSREKALQLPPRRG